MPITTYYANSILDTLAASGVYLSLHTGDPGDNGANELAVDRVQPTWDPAASKTLALADPVIFTNCPGGVEVVAFGIWDAASAGNCMWTSFLMGAPKAFTGEDTADLLTCPGHGLAEDDRVVFYDDGIGTLPTGVSEATLYHVIADGLTTDAFKISTTQGGSAVNITAKGQGWLAKVTTKIIANEGDSFNLTAAPLSFV